MGPAKHNSNEERTSKILKKKEQKIDKKVSFYAKVKDCVRSLHAKKEITIEEEIWGSDLPFESQAIQSVRYYFHQNTGYCAVQKKKRRSRRNKLKAYDLSTLSEFLPDFKSSKPQPEASLTFRRKNKQRLVEKESRHLKAVLAHPAFQTDPLSTIHQHILNTQPLSADEPKPKQDEARRKSRRRGAKVVSSDVQSMDTI